VSDDLTHAILLTRLAVELLETVARAIERGADVSDAQRDAAVARASAAVEKWRAASGERRSEADHRP
jgi:acyl-CoA reductase-like NAD-dependent aldehyde dehydrogenase